MGIRVLHRYGCRNSGPFVAGRIDDKSATQQFRSLPHADEAESMTRSFGSESVLLIETLAIVFHDQLKGSTAMDQMDGRGGGMRMFGDVG